MAARTRTYQTEKTREKIQATQIVNRLYKAFSGDLDPTTNKPLELTSTQVKIGLGLLAKVMPDMTHNMTEDVTEPMNAEQVFMTLVDKIGESSARKLYPDMAKQYLDKEPAQVLSIVR